MSVVTENFPDISFIDDATVEETMNQMIADYQEKYKELTGKDVSLLAGRSVQIDHVCLYNADLSGYAVCRLCRQDELPEICFRGISG